MDLEGWSNRLKVFADATRVRLLSLLEGEELTVAELSAITQLAQPRVSTHLAKLKEAGLVRDRRAGVSAYYRFDDAALDPVAACAVAVDQRRQRRSAAAPGRRTRAGRAGDARRRPELGRLGRRRHGAPLLPRPHLGSAGAHGAAAAAAGRRARHRLRRRRAGRTAGAAFAPLRLHRHQPARRRRRRRAPAPISQCRSARGRHACPALRRRRFRPGRADARADLCRQARAGRGRGRARAARGGRLLLAAWRSTNIAPWSRPTATSTWASARRNCAGSSTRPACRSPAAKR